MHCWVSSLQKSGISVFWNFEGVTEIALSLLGLDKGDSGGEAIEDKTGTVLVGES